MPIDNDSYVIDASVVDVAGTVNAALAGYRSVRIAATGRLKAPINVPPNRTLYSEGMNYLIKEFNGPMIVMDGSSEVIGLLLEGDGADYDGPGIVLPANTSQQSVERVRVMRTRGIAIDCTAVGAGTSASFEKCTLQRHNPTLPAMVLPGDDAGIVGLRRVNNCRGAGGMLIDLAGSNYTKMSHCDTVGIAMSEAATYASFIDNRLAVPLGTTLDVHGANHGFLMNATVAKVRFMPDAYGCTYSLDNRDGGVELVLGCSENTFSRPANAPPIVDNSGNDTNRVVVTSAI
jgi:hypothetical protein